MSIIALHTPTAAGGLTKWEIAAINKAAEGIDGCRTAISFGCVGGVTLTCGVVDGPTFKISRVDRKILLTTTWLDAKDYVSEHWSVPGALRAFRAMVSKATEAKAA
jgi:hypothetical protein